jgi:23S rRNA maturation-related 3'-5' exoribonuclease YhaM
MCLLADNTNHTYDQNIGQKIGNALLFEGRILTRLTAQRRQENSPQLRLLSADFTQHTAGYSGLQAHTLPITLIITKVSALYSILRIKMRYASRTVKILLANLQF